MLPPPSLRPAPPPEPPLPPSQSQPLLVRSTAAGAKLGIQWGSSSQLGAPHCVLLCPSLEYPRHLCWRVGRARCSSLQGGSPHATAQACGYLGPQGYNLHPGYFMMKTAPKHRDPSLLRRPYSQRHRRTLQSPQTNMDPAKGPYKDCHRRRGKQS